MGEPPSRSRFGRPGLDTNRPGGPGDLLATKLFVPRPPAGLVPRARLVGRLQDGSDRPLTLVCAPAGFGKTALLADWCSRVPQPAGWLSLDSGDNDPVRFWRHVAAALDRIRPGLADQVEPLLGSPGTASFEGPVTALVNALAADPVTALLVLDDYHVVDAPPVHASLQFLLDNAPPGLRVVLASRADPPLPLARWRAGGRLVELRAADLRFTSDEAAAMLQAIVGAEVTLPGDAPARLTERTEGWAAGLQLAGLSLQGVSDVAGLVESFSGSHRYVLDYLTEEVLEHQPVPVRDFLLETSVLSRLSGPLCDAVTGRAGSQQILEAIERANLFLVPLDEVRGWWRYHQLFADLLRVRLNEHAPDRVRELHANAAEWFERHGPVDAAVRHTLAAGDPGRAGRLVERHADEVLMRGEGATLERWVQALPAGVVRARPRLLLAEARLAILQGHLDHVEELLDAAERVPTDDDREPYRPSLDRGAAPLANVPAIIAVDRAFVANLRGDADRAAGYAAQALAVLTEEEWLLTALARLHQAVAGWLRGDVDTADRGVAAGIDRWLASRAQDYAVLWSYFLAEIRAARGRLDQAATTCRQALELAVQPDRPPRPTVGTAYLGLAQVAYQRNELDVARRHLAEALPLCRQLALTQPLATGLALQALLHRADGETAAARAAMDEAARAAPETVVDLLNPAPALRARLLLATGDVAGAAQWLTDRGVSAAAEPDYPREPAYLVAARVLLAQQQPGPALRLLDRLRTAAAADGRVGSLIEIQAVRALALAAAGDHAGSLTTLGEALTLAHPQGYIRIFTDEGPPMAALLGQLIAATRERPATVPVSYLGRLARSFEPDQPQPAAAPYVPGLVTQLSERELEVLQLLAAGKANREIAEQLFVTLHTVKKHVTHILDKLGAGNRTEATARARELGLLG